MNVVAKNMKRIIEENGYKQTAIAQKSGFSDQQFSDMLYERKLIKAEYIPQFCVALRCTPNDLFQTA